MRFICLGINRSTAGSLRLIMIFIAWVFPRPCRCNPTACIWEISWSTHSSPLSNEHSSNLIRLFVVAVPTLVEHLYFLYSFCSVHSSSGVFILKWIDHEIEILDVVRLRISGSIRIKLSEWIINGLEVEGLFHFLSTHLWSLIDRLELSLPSFIVYHKLWVVVA